MNFATAPHTKRIHRLSATLPCFRLDGNFIRKNGKEESGLSYSAGMCLCVLGYNIFMLVTKYSPLVLSRSACRARRESIHISWLSRAHLYET